MRTYLKHTNTILKNYLFTVPFRVQDFRSYRIHLLVFLLISVLCSSQVSAAVIDSTNSQRVSPNTIYISSGTTVFGSINSVDVTVVKIQNKTVAEKITKGKNKVVNLEKNAIFQKNSQSLELKVLQENINKKVKHFYYSSSRENDLLRTSKLRFASSSTVPNLSFKFNKAFNAKEYDFSIVRLQNTKQKFFTSLSYSEFFKLRNSFLRGPPYFM